MRTEIYTRIKRSEHWHYRAKRGVMHVYEKSDMLVLDSVG